MLFWKPWLDAMRFGFEVQSVIGLRLIKIAAGGAESNAEVTRKAVTPISIEKCLAVRVHRTPWPRFHLRSSSKAR
jgi:hypothetical protein